MRYGAARHGVVRRDSGRQWLERVVGVRSKLGLQGNSQLKQCAFGVVAPILAATASAQRVHDVHERRGRVARALTGRLPWPVWREVIGPIWR